MMLKHLRSTVTGPAGRSTHLEGVRVECCVNVRPASPLEGEGEEPGLLIRPIVLVPHNVRGPESHVGLRRDTYCKVRNKVIYFYQDMDEVKLCCHR